MSEQQKIISHYRTFAEALVKVDRFKGRKRHSANDDYYTPKRIWLEQEVEQLFASQRKSGNEFATLKLKKNIKTHRSFNDFCKILFTP